MNKITGLSIFEARKKLEQCIERELWYADDHVLFDNKQRFPRDFDFWDKKIEIKRLLNEGLLTINIGYEPDTFVCLASNDYSKGGTRIALFFYFDEESEEMCIYHFYRKDIW
jgi:hypothetical protein